MKKVLTSLDSMNTTLNALNECVSELRRAIIIENDKNLELLYALKDIKFAFNLNDKKFSEKEKLEKIKEIIDSVL